MTSHDPSETFRIEAAELLDQLEAALLDLEDGHGQQELVDQAFRALHTLKGSGAMFGFDAVAAFIHDFETVFDQVRRGEAPSSPELIAVALDAKDQIQALIAGEGEDARSVQILAALRDTVDVQASVAGTPGGPVDAAAEPQAARWRIRFKPAADAFICGENPSLLLAELLSLGSGTVRAVTEDIPPLAVIEPESCYMAWEVELETAAGEDVIRDVFMFCGEDLSLTVSAMEAPGEAAAHGVEAANVSDAADATVPAGKAKDTRSAVNDRSGGFLKVSAERLDALMDQVGELVIAQTRLSQLSGAAGDPALLAISEELERLSGGLREISMGIRMVQIGVLFGRFRRLAHDLSRDLGKAFDFVTEGEDTELDKTMIERLADPLVHLIRNAADHGLETSAQRVAAGKSPNGTLKLEAAYVGAEIAITLSDDGAGLDTDRIRAKAVESGLIAPDAPLSDEEIHQLIFAPGFSTAGAVTALSGRGVGMDVVKRNIEAMRGTIDLVSRPGEGTSFRLRLPLTLAILDGMLVRVGDGCYSIPLAAVEECVELTATGTCSRNRNFLNIRDRLVPYFHLAERFGSEGPRDPHQKVVIVSSGEARVGLVVDQILGNHQIVIKHLSRFHQALRTFSGATILGDGSVALILDVAQLIETGQAEARQADPDRRAA